MKSVSYARQFDAENASMYLRVGVIGCGNISDIYLKNSALFKNVKYVACADIKDDAAEKQANQYGLRHHSIVYLFSSPWPKSDGDICG
jgi:predicted dehydrogenase